MNCEISSPSAIGTPCRESIISQSDPSVSMVPLSCSQRRPSGSDFHPRNQKPPRTAHSRVSSISATTANQNSPAVGLNRANKRCTSSLPAMTAIDCNTATTTRSTTPRPNSIAMGGHLMVGTAGSVLVFVSRTSPPQRRVSRDDDHPACDRPSAVGSTRHQRTHPSSLARWARSHHDDQTTPKDSHGERDSFIDHLCITAGPDGATSDDCTTRYLPLCSSPVRFTDDCRRVHARL